MTVVPRWNVAALVKQINSLEGLICTACGSCSAIRSVENPDQHIIRNATVGEKWKIHCRTATVTGIIGIIVVAAKLIHQEHLELILHKQAAVMLQVDHI